jgi:hypothetical protein
LFLCHLGDAAEQDETFWGDGIWGESDDESFSEVEVEPDQFDSDFNDTEDEGGNSEDDEKAVKKTSETEVTAQLPYHHNLFHLFFIHNTVNYSALRKAMPEGGINTRSLSL